METFQRMHQDLPEEIRSRIYKFMSHPLADVMRPLVEHWREWDQSLQGFFEEHLSVSANTFYMFHFSNQKLRKVAQGLERVQTKFGIRLGVSERSLRPRLWRLYEREQPGFFGYVWPAHWQSPLEGDPDFSPWNSETELSPAGRRSSQSARSTGSARSKRRSTGSRQRCS